MKNIMTIPDDTSIFQFLTFVKLQLQNGYSVNQEFDQIYYEYLNYCKRNKIRYKTKKAFSMSLNKLGLESVIAYEKGTGKRITEKELNIENIEVILSNLGGDMTVENIYTVLNNKRYQIQMKIIPLDTPDIEALEKQAKELNLLTKVEPDHSGETK